MSKKIFLSYSYEDKPWVTQLVDKLKEEGVSVWFDMVNIELGEAIQDSIAKALRESDTLVVVLTKNSIKSQWIYFELGAAVAGGKTIIPVVTEEIDFKELPPPLLRYQYLKESSPIQAAEKLSESLKKMA